jgi:hypothetical protein
VAGLALDKIDPSNVGGQPEIWEKVQELIRECIEKGYLEPGNKIRKKE